MVRTTSSTTRAWMEMAKARSPRWPGGYLTSRRAEVVKSPSSPTKAGARMPALMLAARDQIMPLYELASTGH